MRDIKFRLFDSQTKEMLYKISDHWTYWEDGNTLSGNQDYLILEQYTGLQDKNGKGIYEGDILTPVAYAGFTKDKRFKCEVVFKKGMFCFAVRKPFIAKSDPLYLNLNRGKTAGNDYIINGNIHENPELLKED